VNYSRNGFDLTKQFESCRLTAYPDPGTGGVPFTVGYGHTGADIHEGMTITQQQADLYLAEDVQKAVDEVNARVHTDLSQEEFDALVDFVFNVGAGNFNNSTLLKCINAGDMEGAARQFDRWDKADGRVLAGLVRRRQAETQEFLSGIV
jgi:lysozyme